MNNEQDIDLGLPILLTREQAATWCQVSLETLDQWTYEPGFPVVRRPGGHFVRIHRTELAAWLAEKARASNARPIYELPEPRVKLRRGPLGGASGTS